MNAKQIIENAQCAKSAREKSNIDDLWQTIAERVKPALANITKTTNDVAKSRHVFDSTASDGVEKFASAIQMFVMPQDQKYQKVSCSDEELYKKHREWFDEATNEIFLQRYNGRSGFITTINQTLERLAIFGGSPIFIDVEKGKGLYYQALLPKDVYVMPDNRDRLRTFYRYFELNKENAILQFGDKTPKKILEAKDDKEKFKFIQYMGLATKEQEKKYGKPYYTAYVCEDEKEEIIEQSGLNSLRFTYPRIAVQDTTWYGYSPCQKLLPEIKMINGMRRMNLRTAQKAGDTSYLSANDEVLNPMSIGSPNSVIYGGISPEGKEMVKPLNSFNGALPYSLDQEEKTRETIKKGLLVDLFQLLIDSPQKTATQVLEEEKEKGSLLGPYASRVETECLTQLGLAELDLLIENNQISQMPDELKQAFDDKKVWFTFEYDNPVRNSGKAQRGIGLQRVLELVANLAQLGMPEALNAINIDRSIILTAEAFNAPNEIFNTPEEKQAKEQAQQQQQQAQMAMQATQVATQAEKDLSQAEKNKAAARGM